MGQRAERSVPNKWEQAQISVFNRAYDWLNGKLRKKWSRKFLPAISFLVPLIGGFLIKDILSTFIVSRLNLPFINEAQPNLIPQSSPPTQDVLGDESPLTPLEKLRLQSITSNPCNVENIRISEEFNDARGDEKLHAIDSEDSAILSASGSARFQGSKIYQSSCSLPLEVTFTFTPMHPDSVGVFFEYEGVFKLLFGDGDLISWTLQKNDTEKRNQWPTEKKEKLPAPFALDKEVTVTLVMQQEDNYINLLFSINYKSEKAANYELFERRIIFKPEAVNVGLNQPHGIRIGLNDSYHKGLASKVKFGMFSIKPYRLEN